MASKWLQIRKFTLSRAIVKVMFIWRLCAVCNICRRIYNARECTEGVVASTYLPMPPYTRRWWHITVVAATLSSLLTFFYRCCHFFIVAATFPSLLTHTRPWATYPAFYKYTSLLPRTRHCCHLTDVFAPSPFFCQIP